MGLVLTNAQYELISNTPFIYLTDPGLLIIPDSTTTHVNSKMQILHTKEVCIFCQVTGVKHDLVQKIVATVE